MVTFWLQKTGEKTTVVVSSMTKLTKGNNHTATHFTKNINHKAINLLKIWTFNYNKAYLFVHPLAQIDAELSIKCRLEDYIHTNNYGKMWFIL